MNRSGLGCGGGRLGLGADGGVEVRAPSARASRACRAAPPPGRSAHTSGGVRSSWPSRNGSLLGVDRVGRVAVEAAAGARGAAGGDDRLQPGQRVDAELVHVRCFSIPTCSMPSSSKRLAVGRVAGALVERQRVGLRVHADPAGAGGARLALGGGEQRARRSRGRARSARTHRRAEARRAAGLDQHPAGAEHARPRPPRGAAPRRRGRRGRRRTCTPCSPQKTSSRSASAAASSCSSRGRRTSTAIRRGSASCRRRGRTRVR